MRGFLKVERVVESGRVGICDICCGVAGVFRNPDTTPGSRTWCIDYHSAAATLDVCVYSGKDITYTYIGTPPPRLQPDQL